MTGLLYDSLIADVSCRVARVLGFLFATTERRRRLAPFRARVEPLSLAHHLPGRCQVLWLHLSTCLCARKRTFVSVLGLKLHFQKES